MLGSRLYVGNLKYGVTSEQLNELFGGFGQVKYAKVMEGKGFGFVELENDADADAAIAKYNGMEVDGRKLTVNEARPMEPRAPREGGFRGNDRGNDRGGRSW